MSMLLAAAVGTVAFGILSIVFDRSVFARYLLIGWLVFCAVVAVGGYMTYSNIGRPGWYLITYPATIYVSLGVAVTCAVAAANIVLRIR